MGNENSFNGKQSIRYGIILVQKLHDNHPQINAKQEISNTASGQSSHRIP